MGTKKLISLTVAFAAFSAASAFIHLTPHDKEVIYQWHAVVRAGTDLPTPHASQFILDGKVHVQSDTNSTWMKISDLTVKLYNGVLDHEREHMSHPMPVTEPDLQEVFRVIYSDNGMAAAVGVESKEREFSKNMKKAIATIFQMDKNVMKESQLAETFIVKENSIYGMFDVDYTVRHHDGKVMVHKMHDMRDAHHLYQYMVSNTEEVRCDIGYENPLTHISHKEYVIEENVVKHIKTTGGLIYQPFQAKSDHQYVYVNQSFNLVEVIPIQGKLQVQNEVVEDLTYHPWTDDQTGSMMDITNGRYSMNFDTMLPQVQHMLEDMHSYLQHDHIHTSEPNGEKGQMVNRVLRILRMMGKAKLIDLHQMLTGNALTMFHHMLPLIGTYGSTLLVKDLVLNKTVDDDVAVRMLQNYAEHVMSPTPELVSKMEDLIHREDLPWNVRKHAIVNFGTLVHKAHVMAHKHHHKETAHEHEQHDQNFDKYVTEYVNKMKTAKEYKVHMAYVFGLVNMQMHKVIPELRPLMHEWSDYHRQVSSLWAIGMAALADKNPNIVMEVFWPIFTNVHEITELRMMAFQFLIESKINHSILMNMYEVLLHETNEELYKYAHTTLKSLSEVHNVCGQELKISAAHIVHLLPPPSHGVSSHHIYDYKDVKYGFSSEIRQYMMAGNHSYMYLLSLSTQQFHISHENYAVYVKLHGLHYQKDPVSFMMDVFKNKLSKKLTNKNIHIEVVTFMHGHAISTHFFDNSNLHELDRVLDFFTKDKHSLSSNLLHIFYNELHQVLIPSDVGMPIIWDYWMPMVHQSNVSISKEIVNNVINIHVDNKYITWSHFRHGLTLYNPLADVWHGINRFHSYDSVWPMKVDIAWNPQQQSVQLAWKKDDKNSVMGFRSHVRQMVFVKDDHKSNILKRSSPQNEDEYITVSSGKKYHNEYTIMQDQDLGMGIEWYVAIYDSQVRFSNGSIGELMTRLTKSHRVHSPVQHLIATWANFHQSVFLQPIHGSHGVIVRIEPHHQVTNIDLSVRLHSEDSEDKEFHYSPKSKWSSRVTYTVKNQEKALKTWDVNSMLDMNSGHTVNNIKMHITRKVPGKQDYKICVDGMKKWTHKEVSGHLNIAMSETADGKCVKDDTVVDVTMQGGHSMDQNGQHKYGSCDHISPYSVPHKHSMECLVDHTSVRHYTYNVKTTNVPSEFRKTLAHWWDSFKGMYMSQYQFEDEHHDNIGEHNLKVDVVYPMEKEEMDVHVTTPEHKHHITAVPTHLWKWMGMKPDSLEYSMWFRYLHNVGHVDHCVVHVDRHILNSNEVHEMVPTEWTLVVGDVEQNPKKGVFVKQQSNTMSVKIVDHSHVVEVVPQGTDHQVTLDGKVVPLNEYHAEDWIFVHVFMQDHDLPVAMMLHHSGIHVEYHHHQVVVVVPRGENWHGHCYSHQ